MTKQGFTLIELLIVVLIIAILAAIAVPNFLEFQVRSKVSRALADMRSADLGLKAYTIDNDAPIPPPGTGTPPHGRTTWPASITVEVPGTIMDAKNCPHPTTQLRLQFRTYAAWCRLTTPVAYMSTIPFEAFSLGLPYAYHPKGGGSGPGDIDFVLIESMGPDQKIGSFQSVGVPTYPPGVDLCGDSHPPYDPTNGSVSNGEIYKMSVIYDLEEARMRFDTFLQDID